MTLLEIIAVLLSLICIWLAVKKHVLNWPVGILAVSAYLLLFYRERLYADMCLQMIFIGQGFYGWYNWLHIKQKDEPTISSLSLWGKIICLLVIISFSLFWNFLLVSYTNASSPMIDSFASTISLVANWLMARKKIENWILWILADILYIALFWNKELFLSSFIYLVFLVLATKGFVNWKKAVNTRKDLS